MKFITLFVLSLLLIAPLSSSCTVLTNGEPIKVGLIAPLSGPSAASGEAIQRGMLLAMDEINGAGGVLGRPLQLVARDIPNDPEAGVAALRELVKEEQIVAVFGGIFSPVMMAQLDAIHELKVPLINPWGSMAAITRNGHTPNYAFRVSVSDLYADEFLVRYALTVIGATHPAILADTSDWGKANVAGLQAWFTQLGVSESTVAGTEHFDQGDSNMTSQLERLRANGADTLIMVANAPEGAAIVRGLATLGWQVPIVSHWGVSGGNFAEMAGKEFAEGVMTLQTFSFAGELSAKAQQVLAAYQERFDANSWEEVEAPVGVVHGYDGLHLLAQAIRQAGTTAGPALQAALENLAPVDGLVTRYAPAFTVDRHDALLAKDYLMAVWRNGILVPATPPRLPEGSSK